MQFFFLCSSLHSVLFGVQILYEDWQAEPPFGTKMTDPPLKQGWKLHDPPPSYNMDVWFPLNNPIKPCSVFDKICWYSAATNIKITEIIPFTEKTNMKNLTFLVSMNVTSLDTNIQQNAGILKLSVTKHMKISTKTTHSYTLLAGNA